MRDAELWVEAYQGEVLGEAFFGVLADRQEDPVRKHQLDVLRILERSTKELAEPVFERRGLDPGDTARSIADAKGMADASSAIPWEQFLDAIEPTTSKYLAKYRELLDLVDDEEERGIAEAYVAHEQALTTFARRALGREAGEPLDEILALPHVAAAMRNA